MSLVEKSLPLSIQLTQAIKAQAQEIEWLSTPELFQGLDTHAEVYRKYPVGSFEDLLLNRAAEDSLISAVANSLFDPEISIGMKKDLLDPLHQMEIINEIRAGKAIAKR